MESMVPIIAAVILLLLVYFGRRQDSSNDQPAEEHVTYGGKLVVRTEPGTSRDVARQIREILGLRLFDVCNVSDDEVAVSTTYPNRTSLTSAIERIEQIPEVVVVQTHEIRPRYDNTRKIVPQGG